nr:immunoglobulin light chain junction region [Macaca mulatta]MOW29535.1 immunoglobulin light chain junction region [Macaca mulatta]
DYYCGSYRIGYTFVF